MTTENVFSPIKDNGIEKNVINSTIWKNCYKEEELTDEIKEGNLSMYRYTIKFDGLKPVQVTNVKKIK